MVQCSSSGCFNILKLFWHKEKEVGEVLTYKTVGYQMGAPHTISCDFTMCYKTVFIFTVEDINDCVC